MSEPRKTNELNEPETNGDKPSGIPKTLGIAMTFFGIFFLVASLFSLLTLVVLQASSGDSRSLSDQESYAMILAIATILTSASAVYVGIKLIKQLDIGRKLFNILTLIVIALAWVKFAYQKNQIEKSFSYMPAELAASARQTELAGALMVFILPIILILVALLLNRKRSKLALNR